MDAGVTISKASRFIQQDTTSASPSYTIPEMADILVMYSTYEGEITDIFFVVTQLLGETYFSCIP